MMVGTGYIDTFVDADQVNIYFIVLKLPPSACYIHSKEYNTPFLPIFFNNGYKKGYDLSCFCIGFCFGFWLWALFMSQTFAEEIFMNYSAQS